MLRYTAWRWLPVTVALWFVSCYGEPSQNNPLEGHTANLVLPVVTSPTGWEQFFPGTMQEIRWKPATAAEAAVVTVRLECDGVPTRVIASDIPNTGTLAWKVPDTPAPACRIRVVGHNGPSMPTDSFRINPAPVLARLDIDDGREPSAFGPTVVFTSNRSGNDDLWLFNRERHTLEQLTFGPGFDGEAALFKGAGEFVAFTSDRSGQREVWAMETGGATPIQITSIGGEQPAWRNTGLDIYTYVSTQFPSLQIAFKIRTDHLVRVYLNTRFVPDPLAPYFIVHDGPPINRSLDYLTGDEAGSASDRYIRSVTWGYPNGRDVIVYGTGLPHSYSLWRINANAGVDPVWMLPPVQSPSRPALSIDGTRLAFASEGDLWVMALNGRDAVQLTYGDDYDNYPDWATNDEIVFQRGHSEIWTVQVP